ncbi:MAG: hypothetical protein QM709_13865 [Spongiibacteraceae bacterium]
MAVCAALQTQRIGMEIRRNIAARKFTPANISLVDAIRHCVSKHHCASMV